MDRLLSADVASTGDAEVAHDDVIAVGEKLKALRGSLPDGERLVLDRLLEYLATKVRAEPTVQDLLADIPGQPELLDDVAGFMLEARVDPIDLVTKATATDSRFLCLPDNP